jgi:N-acetylneuraminic acid mutarotase
MKQRTLIVVLVVIILGSQTIKQYDAEYVHSTITVKPEPRVGHEMVFDPHNDVAMIFGGTTLAGGLHFLDDTWIYSYTENTWTELVLTPSPPADDNMEMVYCSEANEIIFYGGDSSTETWSFDCETQTWSRVMTSSSPGFLDSFAMVYDTQENVVILFGGFNGDGLISDEFWMFNCSSREWIELFPPTSPPARYGHAMAYDESINRVVLTGGNTFSDGYKDDTWTYTTSTNSWTELSPIGNVDALKWSSMIYDSVNQKCILFGGDLGDNPSDHTWVYDGQTNAWSQRYPTVTPSGRMCPGLVFDSSNNVVILFGGIADYENPYDDTWTYSYESNDWTDMEESSESTTPTTPTGYVFDPMLLALAVPIGIGVIVVVLVLRRRT